MRELVAAVAGPVQWNDNRKSWLSRAARRANVSYRQAKALFYGEINDPEHKTVRRMQVAAGRHEATELARHFETMAVGLQHRDADFYSRHIDAFVEIARTLRALDGAGTDDGEQG
jgi:hypothetical protein